ncbi:MAG: ParA family partition ATPase [Paracoccaceae bacterium]
MAGKVIAVAQQKGGSGKTTLAVNLAIAFLSRGKSVALLDTDPQGSLGRWFMARRALGLTEGLFFSTSSAWGVSYECEKLKREADFVIIDTPPKVDADLRPALREADLVLVPVASSHVDLWATEGVLDLAAREQKGAWLVMNRTRAGTRLGEDVVRAAGEMTAQLLQATLANRVIYAESLGQGRGAAETGRGAVKTEVAAFADAVLALV